MGRTSGKVCGWVRELAGRAEKLLSTALLIEVYAFSQLALILGKKLRVRVVQGDQHPIVDLRQQSDANSYARETINVRIAIFKASETDREKVEG